MKKRFLPFSLLLVIMILGQSITIADNGGHYVPRTQATANAESFMASLRANQHTGLIDPALMIQAMQSAETRGTNSEELYWLNMGPDNMGGQTTAVLYDNKKNPHGNWNGVVYIGSKGGGVYKTYNHGITWHQVGNQNLMVSCMTQDEDGNIYVGTGDGNYAQIYNGLDQQSYDNSFVGTGVWTINANDEMTKLASTTPSLSEVDDWSFVNDIAFANGQLIVATTAGLKYSEDGGQNWKWAKYLDDNGEAQDLEGKADEVRIGKKTIVASVGGKIYIGDNIKNLVCHSAATIQYDEDGSTIVALPTAAALLDIAIAPDSDNIIYAACIANDGTHAGFYATFDNGATWKLIMPNANANFGHNIYSGYGRHNHGLVVDPSNNKVLYVLGYNLWKLEDSGTNGGYYICSQLTDGSNVVYYSYDYLHVGLHAMTFNPNPDYKNECYIGTDGGIYKGVSGSTFTFTNCNRNYVTGRMFNVGVSSSPKRIMAAGLDHGTVLISGNGNTDGSGEWINPTGYNMGAYDEAAQAGPCAFSTINPNTIFVTYKSAKIQRSETAGGDWVSTNFTENLSFPSSASTFRMPILLYENYNDTDNLETIWFKNLTGEKIPSGSTIQCMSNNAYPFDYTLPHSLYAGDSIEVHDPITARLFLSFTNAVYMTRTPLQFDSAPTWYCLANKNTSGFVGEPLSMAVSADCDNLWVGTKAGRLFRLSNINTVVDDASGTMSDTINFQVVTTEIELPVSGQCITSIAVDPRNANKVVVTLGNYGNNDYVLSCADGLSSNPSFTSMQANLPKMPVYASLIEKTSGQVILGTEHGIYTSNSFSNPNWTFDGKAMGDVPVMELKQQLLDKGDEIEIVVSEEETIETVYPGVYNTGVIYAATYGRGMFRCENYKKEYENVPEATVVTETTVEMYPNPAREQAWVNFEMKSSTNVSYQVYDMMGRLVMSQNLGRLAEGKQQINLNTSELGSGSYILRLNQGSNNATVKFMVY